MFKKFLAVLAMLFAATAFAAVDANKATAADLDGIKGIGPVTSRMILSERKKGEFKDWEDLITRVKGVGPNTATKLSAGGLTVNGEGYKSAAAIKKEEKAAKKAEQKAAKAADKPVAAATPATPATPAAPAASAKK
ncbi:MAG: ComEA family DNA-binding protein [Ramlibacter sp.]